MNEWCSRNSCEVRGRPQRTNLAEHPPVDDAAEYTHRVCAKHLHVCAVDVLLQAVGDDDHSIGAVRQLLDQQVRQPTKVHVLALEQLRDSEEQLGCLLHGERLALRRPHGVQPTATSGRG